jgi:HSP20 family protein
VIEKRKEVTTMSTGLTNRQASQNDTMSAEKMQRRDRPVVTPLVDVFENKDEYLILADVPGTTADALAIHLEESELTIEAKRTAQKGTPMGGEYVARDYVRSFVIPRGVDTTKIDASLKDGVLTLKLPKHETKKPRRIDVKAG